MKLFRDGFRGMDASVSRLPKAMGPAVVRKEYGGAFSKA